MNRRSFLYILAKPHAKIIKSKQGHRNRSRINVAGACRLLIRDCEQLTCTVYLNHIFGYSLIVYSSEYLYTKRCRFLNIFAKFQSKIQEKKQDITNSST